MLLPEEAALVLDEGLASLCMLVPPQAVRGEQHHAMCGASASGGGEGSGEPEDVGRVPIPHVSADGADASRDGGCFQVVELRKSEGAAAGWGIAAQELRATRLEPEDTCLGAHTKNKINNKEIGSGLRALVSRVRKRVREHMSASERGRTGEEEEEEEACSQPGADEHVLGVGEGGKDAAVQGFQGTGVAQGLQDTGGLEVLWIFPATQVGCVCVCVCVWICGSVDLWMRYASGRAGVHTHTHTHTQTHTHTHAQEERRRAAVYRHTHTHRRRRRVAVLSTVCVCV